MRKVLIVLIALALAIPVLAQAPTVVSKPELKPLVPTTYFFRGLNATVQARNAAALKFSDNKFLIVALVDTTGYSSGVAQEYQGLLITEKTIDVGGQKIPPGQYGFGFNKAGKFHLMDVSMKELATADAGSDEKLAHPVPLKLELENGQPKLYIGRKYASFTVE